MKRAKKDLVDLLNELAELYSILGENYREKAYKTAASNIRHYLPEELGPETIPSLEQNRIPGVGKGISGKISEFIRTGRIIELLRLRKSKIVQAYRAFGGVLGVGPTTAKKFINMGLYTLSDLRRAVKEKRVVLTDVQKIGLD